MAKADSFVRPPVSLVSEALLPELLLHVFPDRASRYSMLTGLVRPSNRHKVTQRSGVWLVREPECGKGDTTGWGIIHWPSLTRYLLTHAYPRQVLRAHGITHYHLLTPRNNPEAFRAQWATFKRGFRRFLPPGSQCWAGTQAFKKLLTFIPSQWFLQVTEHPLVGPPISLTKRALLGKSGV